MLLPIREQPISQTGTIGWRQRRSIEDPLLKIASSAIIGHRLLALLTGAIVVGEYRLLLLNLKTDTRIATAFGTDWLRIVGVGVMGVEGKGVVWVGGE